MGLSEINNWSGLVHVSLGFCIYIYKYILLYHIIYIILQLYLNFKY